MELSSTKISVAGGRLIAGRVNVMNMREKPRQEGSWYVSRTGLPLWTSQVQRVSVHIFSGCSKNMNICVILYLPLSVCEWGVCPVMGW